MHDLLKLKYAQRVTMAVLIACLGAIAPAQVTRTDQRDTSLQPQIEFAGEAAATLDLGRRGTFGGRGFGTGSRINISDSGLVFGASQRLYRSGIGSFSFGGVTTDESSAGGGRDIFMHQALVDFQNLKFEAFLGRTDTPTSRFIEFPTLRGDDLIEYRTVLNPFSNGETIEEHRYSNVAAVEFNQGLKYFENVHAQHLIDSAGGDTGSGINSVGVSFQFRNVPTLEALQRVVTYGVGFEHRDIQKSAGGNSDVIYGGGVVNLNRSVVNRTDLRLFAAKSFGSDVNSLTNLTDTFRSDATSVALSLRNHYSPFGSPGHQLALTLGYRNYEKVKGASSYGAALSYAQNLGDGFDAVFQIVHEHRNGQLVDVFGRKDSTSLQLGFVYNFGSVFNKSVGPRRSPVNLLHKYIPN